MTQRCAGPPPGSLPAAPAAGRTGRPPGRPRPATARSPRPGSRCAPAARRPAAGGGARRGPRAPRAAPGASCGAALRRGRPAPADRPSRRPAPEAAAGRGPRARPRRHSQARVPASSSSSWGRWTSRVRSWACAVRYLVRSRSSRIGVGGTTQGRTRPWATSWQIQAASATPVLRPGTLRRCWAPGSQHSTSSSSRSSTHFQNTPVDSIPATATPELASQSPSGTSPGGRRPKRADLAVPPAVPARDPHARGDRRLVHVQPGDPLDEPVHQTSCPPTPPRRRPESLIMQRLGGVLAATIRGARGSRVPLIVGLTSTRRSRRRRATRPHFHPPGWPARAMSH